jgi:hypothetical protein
MIKLDLKELLGSDYEFLDEEQTTAAIYTPFLLSGPGFGPGICRGDGRSLALF